MNILAHAKLKEKILIIHFAFMERIEKSTGISFSLIFSVHLVFNKSLLQINKQIFKK